MTVAPTKEHPIHPSDRKFLDRMFAAAAEKGWKLLPENGSESLLGRFADFTLGRRDRQVFVTILPRAGLGRFKLMSDLGSRSEVEETETGWRFRLGGVVIGSLEEDPARVIEMLGTDE